MSLSDNYYLRKHHLRSDTVPTQSVIKERMTPPLAAVYFKTMTPQLKVIAGLEPPMKGGGKNWCVHPQSLLKGQTVKKPENKACLDMLNYDGIDAVGTKLQEKELRNMEYEKKRMLKLSDEYWKQNIEARAKIIFEKYSNDAKKQITAKLKKSLGDFKALYSTSLSHVEQLLSETTSDVIKTKKDEAHQKMTERFQYLVKKQSLELQNKYDKLLEDEKMRLKNKFIEDLEIHRAQTAKQIHDLKIKKHLALESFRKYVTYQRRACQVYVSLKERDECRKQIELSKSKYQKKVRKSKDEILSQTFNIHLFQEKAKKRQEFITSWQKKVQKLLKHLQMFMAYCLDNLPEHAEFFVNLEKLLLLQLSEAFENPGADSIIECEPEYTGPVPKPYPFYLLCDKGYKPVINQDLCPKHCTSSATQLPVVIINKRFMYSACDNFEQYSEKLTQFMYRHTEDDLHLEDRHIYEFDVPVKCTSSQQLLELKLESSLQQILQEELCATQCLMCPVRKMSCCLCSMIPLSAPPSEYSSLDLFSSMQQLTEEKKWPPNRVVTRSMELIHEREPKWESYLKFVETKTCSCSKTIRKDMMEHLPPYMRQISVYEAPELPNYERCSILSVKKLVKKARNKTSTPSIKSFPSKTRDAVTQYHDEEFDTLCNCFTTEDFEKFVYSYSPIDASKLILETSSIGTNT